MTTATEEEKAKADKKKPAPAKKSEKKVDVLQLAIDQLHEKEGKDSLTIGLNSGVVKCDVISTRCLALDLALGVGGVPKGRITEIFGPESCGKTTIASTIVAQAQSQGEVACYLDVENAIDPEYMGDLGVNLDKLLFSQPDSGEQVFRIIEKLLDTGRVSVIVVDSVAAMATEAELKGEVGDKFIAEQARLISINLRKLSGKIRRSNCALVFINQLREKAGQRLMPGQSSEQTPGGRALKFYASVRIDARRIGSLKEGDKIVANQTRVKIVKNKVAPPFRQAVFDIVFGAGIDGLASILDVAVANKFVTKNGANYSFAKEAMGVGRPRAIEWLKENPERTKELDKTLRETLFSKITEGTAVTVADPDVVPESAGADDTSDDSSEISES